MSSQELEMKMLQYFLHCIMEIYTCYGVKAPVGPNFNKGCIRENVKNSAEPVMEMQ